MLPLTHPKQAQVLKHTLVKSLSLSTFPQLDAIQDLLVSFTWDGPRVVDGNFSPMESVVGLTYTSRLMLSNVASLDEGKYTCTVVVYSAGIMLYITYNISLTTLP